MNEQQLRAELQYMRMKFDLLVQLMDQANIGEKGSTDLSGRVIKHYGLKIKR